METLSPPLPSGTPPAPTAPPLAPGPAAATPPTAPAASDARQSVPLFGGYRGGRPRKDGFTPGSREALEADRARDAERKARARERARAAEPPPLPPAPRLAGAPAPPPGSLGPSPLPVAFEGDAPVLAWEARQLAPIFEQLLPTVEELMRRQILDRADKAGLPDAVKDDIEADAGWNPASRKALNLAGPQCAAKWLTKAGLSPENQSELVLGTAIAAIMAGHVLLLRRLDKLIRVARTALPPPAGKEVKP